jgi:CheY-like chemotaxis protein
VPITRGAQQTTEAFPASGAQMSDQIERLFEAAMTLSEPPEVDDERELIPVPSQPPAPEQPAPELAADQPKILIVDDDDGFRTMIRDWLADEGLTDIREANNGADAVEIASSLEPDLILMDVRMPKMNGIEAAERIREFQPAVQIVMLSGYEDTVLREAGEKAGLYAYLVKGCPPDVLWRTIRFALKS